MNDIKTLTRSKSNRMIAGVCAGLADYLNIDPTVVRLLFVLGFFLAWSWHCNCLSHHGNRHPRRIKQLGHGDAVSQRSSSQRQEDILQSWLASFDFFHADTFSA